jgi:multiple sugar transport system substrate-binding protein
MKKLLILTLVLMLSFTMVLAGCGGGKDVAKAPAEEAPKKEAPADEPKAEEPAVEAGFKWTIPTDHTAEINVWTFWSLEESIKKFNAVYPNIKVNFSQLSWQENHDKLMTTIAAGTGAPDVGYVEANFMGTFNNLPGLEDLQKPPYNLGKYKADFPAGHWSKMMSLDGKYMWGFGIDNPPGVMFYRADELESVGFPSDPEELRTYMQDWNNVIEMAEALKAKDKYLFWYDKQPLDIYIGGIDPFDKDLNFAYNNDEVAKMLDIAKQFKQRQLTQNMNMWSDEGKQATSNGKQIAFYIGLWFAGDMLQKQWANETQAGKWRATHLPGGIYNGSGGTFMVVPTQSKNKEAATAWIEFNSLNLENYAAELSDPTKTWVGSYKPMWALPGFDLPIDYFGGQPVRLVFRDLAQKVPATVRTPLDKQAKDIFNKIMDEALEKNVDSKAALQQAEDEIMKAVSVDREKLLKVIKGQ